MIGLEEFEVEYAQTLEQARTKLHDLFQKAPEARCILLSDTLVDADDAWRPEWAATSALNTTPLSYASSYGFETCGITWLSI